MTGFVRKSGGSAAIGDITRTTRRTVMRGSLPVLGQLVPKAEYAKLYAEIGDRYDALSGMFGDFFRLPEPPADQAPQLVTADWGWDFYGADAPGDGFINVTQPDHYDFAKMVQFMVSNSEPNRWWHVSNQGIPLAPGGKWFLPLAVFIQPSGDGPDLFKLRIGVTKRNGSAPGLLIDGETVVSGASYIELNCSSGVGGSAVGGAVYKTNGEGGMSWDYTSTSLGDVLDVAGFGLVAFALMIDTQLGQISVMRDGQVYPIGAYDKSARTVYPYVGYSPEDTGTIVTGVVGRLYNNVLTTEIPGVGINPNLPLPPGYVNAFELDTGIFTTGLDGTDSYLYTIKAK